MPQNLWILTFLGLSCATLPLGCASLPSSTTENGLGKKSEEKEPPKMLLEWNIGDKKGEDDKKENNCDKTGKAGTRPGNQDGKANDSGGGEASRNERKPGAKSEPMDTDRPDFGAATTTVGKGRVVLETGYVFLRDSTQGTRFTGHNYPDAVLRVGLFADWFEFRIGQSFSNFRSSPITGLLGQVEPARQDGPQDLYLGTKLALTEKKNYLPETAIIFQTTVPTGSKDLTAGRMLPGVVFISNTELIEDRLTYGFMLSADSVVDNVDHYYVQVSNVPIHLKYAWTPRFKNFVEWASIYPTSSIDSSVGPQHYVHPGFQFLITDNFQFDAHVFIGVNRHAIDFFGGPGLSIRY